MKAVVLTGHGGLDKLVIQDDFPVPKPEPHEVLIRVGACGINNTDINTRVGWYSKSVSTGTTAALGAEGINQLSEVDATWGGSGVVFPRIQGADVAGRIVELDLRTLYLKDLEFHGATVMEVGIFEKLVRYIEAGEIRPLLAKAYPIFEIKAAQEAFLKKQHIGNFVILPWQ